MENDYWFGPIAKTREDTFVHWIKMVMKDTGKTDLSGIDILKAAALDMAVLSKKVKENEIQ